MAILKITKKQNSDSGQTASRQTSFYGELTFGSNAGGGGGTRQPPRRPSRDQASHFSQRNQSRQAYEGAPVPNSQQNSRGTLESTPLRKNNANTFYSDGSFTTTSTSIADKLKMLKNNKRINVSGVQRTTDAAHSANPNTSINRAGPIKATRQALQGTAPQ